MGKSDKVVPRKIQTDRAGSPLPKPIPRPLKRPS